MAKIDVILTHNIVGLGGESDQVKVAAGYARNYLLPQGLAVPVNQANKKRLEALRKRRAEREAHDLNSMIELAKSIGKLLTVISVKTGDDGKLFGSVTNGSIADALKTQFDISLDKKKIHLKEPIKTLGEHEVDLRLHAEVHATLKVRIESSTPIVVAALVAPAEGEKTEKRGKRSDAPKAEAAPAKPEGKAKKA